MNKWALYTNYYRRSAYVLFISMAPENEGYICDLGQLENFLWQRKMNEWNTEFHIVKFNY